MKVLVSDPLAKEGLEILEREPGVTVDVKTGLSEDELSSVIPDYDILLVRSGTKVTKRIIAEGKCLKLIGRAGVGVDNVDVAEATKRGIIVMNAPTGNTITTAEHTMALMLSLSRNIPQANNSLKRHEWDRKRFMGVELAGKVLGLIGLGRIGSEVAKRALAFSMKIIAYDPFIARDVASRLGVKLVELDDLCRQADYISLHVPLTPKTRHILSEREFDLMKTGVRIINCARGGVIDEEALLKALESGKVKGAALDVFEQKKPFDSPLLNMENCITVPHLGASTVEAQVNVAVEIANQVVDFLKGKPLRNTVNLSQVKPETLPEVQPFLDLAEKMGSMQAQIVAGNFKEIKVECTGEVCSEHVSMISTAVLKGMLEFIMSPDAPVNYVNVPYLAEERGINILESKSSRVEDFANLISVSLRTEKEERCIKGTLFQKGDPRIVYIDEFRIDAVPDGNLLILSQTDEPGIIGKVGSILGENKINIGWMQLARTGVGEKALSVWNVDEEVSDEILKGLEQIPEVLDVKLARL